MRLADSISLRSRQRKLRLLLDELRPTAETLCPRCRSRRARLRRGRRLRNDELLRGALPVAGAHHGARPARWRRLPGAVPGHPLRPGRRVRAALRRRRVRHRFLERGDRARRRARAPATARLGGDPGRPAGFHHDAESALPGRGAHTPPARPLAPRRACASRVPRDRQGVRDRPPPAHAAELRVALPGARSDRQPRA